MAKNLRKKDGAIPMTNIKKAIAVLDAVDEEQDFLPDNTAYVHALQSKGLLMPDLPEPGSNRSPSWGVVHFDKKRRVIKIGMNGVLARSPKVAREWAYGLLAAAEYAEKGQSNGAN